MWILGRATALATVSNQIDTARERIPSYDVDNNLFAGEQGGSCDYDD